MFALCQRRHSDQLKLHIVSATEPFDHLVGEGEQRRRHGEGLASKRSRRPSRSRPGRPPLAGVLRRQMHDREHGRRPEHKHRRKHEQRKGHALCDHDYGGPRPSEGLVMDCSSPPFRVSTACGVGAQDLDGLRRHRTRLE